MSAPAITRATPVWRGLDEVPAGWGPCVVTLGVFDGLHRGHARLVQRAVHTGRARGLPIVLVTFDPHPARVVGPPRDTAALTTVERRAELAGDLGVDAVCVLPFTPAFARLSPGAFVERVLVGALRAATVVVGANFTFGHRGAGDPALLRGFGNGYGFTVETVALLQQVEAPCSSTYVRERLRAGDVRGAARALGRPHQVDGIAHGGVLAVAEGTALPAPGRYVARSAAGGAPPSRSRRAAACSWWRRGRRASSSWTAMTGRGQPGCTERNDYSADLGFSRFLALKRAFFW